MAYDLEKIAAQVLLELETGYNDGQEENGGWDILDRLGLTDTDINPTLNKLFKAKYEIDLDGYPVLMMVASYLNKMRNKTCTRKEWVTNMGADPSEWIPHTFKD